MHVKNKSYQLGLRSALEDWRIIAPHATRKCPFPSETDAQNWFLGRCKGFQDAELLIKKKPEKLTKNKHGK